METVSEHKGEKTKATKVAIFVAFCLAVSKAVVGFIIFCSGFYFRYCSIIF